MQPPLFRAPVTVYWAMATSRRTKKNTVGGGETESKLLTALSDALCDLGIRVRTLVPSEAATTTTGGGGGRDTVVNDMSTLLRRAFREEEDVPSDSVSLGVVRALIDLVLGASKDRTVAKDWTEVERTCASMGCRLMPPPKLFDGNHVSEGVEGRDVDDRGTMARLRLAERKLELALFLATVAQIRALERLSYQKGWREQKVSSDGSVSSKLRDAPPPLSGPSWSEEASRFLEQLVNRPVEDLNGETLTSILLENYPALSHQQLETIRMCNEGLRSDYDMRKRLLRRKFDVTTSTFLWSGDGGKGASIEGFKNSQDRDKERERKILEISNGVGDRLGRFSTASPSFSRFTAPSTSYSSGPVYGRSMKGEVRTLDRGGRVEEDERCAMPRWNERVQPTGGRAVGDGSGGHRSRGRGHEQRGGRSGRGRGRITK